MMDFKRIPLGIDEFLLVARNGTVFYNEGKELKKVEPTIDVRRRKDKTWSYYRIHVKKKYFYMHKLIATCWIKNPNNFKFTMHKDGNTLNNAVDNLVWVGNSQDVVNQNRMIDTWAFYYSIDKSKLTGQNIFIYDYFMNDNEIPIRAMFHTQKLRAVCKWYAYEKEGDRFETLFDELYENVLSKIKRGVLLPKYGERYDNTLFNYCVKTFDWLCHDRKKQFYEILNANASYLAVN